MVAQFLVWHHTGARKHAGTSDASLRWQ